MHTPVIGGVTGQGPIEDVGGRATAIQIDGVDDSLIL